MKRYQDLITEGLQVVQEVFPWDVQPWLEQVPGPILLDVRENYEFAQLHIPNSLNVPRGILEQACEYGFEETMPELVRARDRKVVVICRSGNRSVLAALTLSIMGYQQVWSLKTGIKGWNDFELPLRNGQGELIDVDSADNLLISKVRADQLAPKLKAHG